MTSEKQHSPLEIFSRELDRLTNDRDRLQMLLTLKLHLKNVILTSSDLQMICVRFNEEKYRLQAIEQLIPWIYTLITSESLIKLLELFHHHAYRLHLIEILKNSDVLKTNQPVHEILRNEHRQYFHVKTSTNIPEKFSPPPPPFVTIPSSDIQASSTTSGVFEKAKQFVCRVFGGSSSQSCPSKRSIDEVNASNNEFECKRLHTLENDYQSTSMSISTSPSYTSLIEKSPPPSPIIRQSSMSFHIDTSSLPMVTQIHSILDNIDSVLDKIEAQTHSVTHRTTLNDNHSAIERQILPVNLDQITQTNMHFNLNDGSGDTSARFMDLISESNSIVSSDQSEEEEEEFD